ncbi:pituitary adenylate cyclase-activating polypeptide [Calonectris borealis]|uniref:pituitary adenylate cyclase-activating polypeptide n=1 Tax=Calonectris borealis TaxID=1323832 RepID=UPI003F4BE1BE
MVRTRGGSPGLPATLPGRAGGHRRGGRRRQRFAPGTASRLSAPLRAGTRLPRALAPRDRAASLPLRLGRELGGSWGVFFSVFFFFLTAVFFSLPHRVAMCSKAILALLVYGIIMHCSVYCSPAAGLQYPALRLEDEVYDEDGNTLQDFAYDHEPLGIANPSSVLGEMYTLYYPPEKRHADGIFNKAYRKLLGQLSARKYLHSLMAKRVGGASGGPGDEAEPLTKRHIDGIFTDSYSRYRKQMAVKKYLAAVLGKRYKQRVKNKGRRVAYL